MERGTAILLGGFDGLHAGHRRLLQRAKESGLAVGVMTIVGGKQGDSLFTSFEREEIFLRAGADFVFELAFDEIKNLSPKDFISLLETQFSPRLFVCGEDFRFGAGAVGTPETLKTSTQVCVETLPLLEIEGEKVSSTHIKRLLKEGRIEKANELLSHPYFLIGKVEEGRKIGRTMGFPTANIAYPKGKFPMKQGVYETRIQMDGVVYKGITNFGARPTFDDNGVWTETYIDGFFGEIYGKELKVEFVRFMREIERFASVDALQAQLTKDIRQVRDQ
ncbi:MAG: riboflavin biosynthesis protein RibF [Clostridia bacterium]|nr:riboflavin biosynthesis protein RibF [Clostridia bacterium]